MSSRFLHLANQLCRYSDCYNLQVGKIASSLRCENSSIVNNYSHSCHICDGVGKSVSFCQDHLDPIIAECLSDEIPYKIIPVDSK